MVTQHGIAPGTMLQPEGSVQERIVLLGRSQVGPYPPQTVQGLEAGPGHVAAIVPEQASMQRRQVSEQGSRQHQGPHSGAPRDDRRGVHLSEWSLVALAKPGSPPFRSARRTLFRPAPPHTHGINSRFSIFPSTRIRHCDWRLRFMRRSRRHRRYTLRAIRRRRWIAKCAGLFTSVCRGQRIRKRHSGSKEDSHMRISRFCFTGILFALVSLAQDADPGRVLFEKTCARCYGSDGNGGELGPAIGRRLVQRNDSQLATLIREGLPQQGMPPNQVTDAEMVPLTRFLRTLQRRPGRPVARLKIQTTDGKTLDGQVLNQGFDDLQLRTDDQQVHLLRRAGDRYREVTSEINWPGYNGDPGGNRYTTLSQITKANVARLGPKWVFSLPNTGRLQV